MRRLHYVTPWTVRDQILEIRAARLHIFRLKTRVAPDSLPWDDLIPLENSCIWFIWWVYIDFLYHVFSTIVLWVWAVCLTGLVHVGDELREVNGNLVTHKRPDEISQILVKKKSKDYTNSVEILLSMTAAAHVWLSVPITGFHYTENYSSCCRRWQDEREPGEESKPFWVFFFLNRINHQRLENRLWKGKHFSSIAD